MPGPAPPRKPSSRAARRAAIEELDRRLAAVPPGFRGSITLEINHRDGVWSGPKITTVEFLNP